MAGPFDDIPYQNYIQSPIGLVPKDGQHSGKTRLIFHLSFEFGQEDYQQSLNALMPRELCTVKYNDLDDAIKNCLQAKADLDRVLSENNNVQFEEKIEGDQLEGGCPIFMSKTDVQSAFRLVPLSMLCWAWLIMKARNPITKRFQYFVDKCLPFGASISCAIFQRFSNALRHIAQIKSGNKATTNYLDDYLFVSYARALCNSMMTVFLGVCEQIGVPISEEKTEWAQPIVTFLGILLNGYNLTLGIPEEKRQKAIYLLSRLIDKKKATVKELQNLCGYLNFLNKAIYP